MSRQSEKPPEKSSQKLAHYSLLAPGPVNLHPRVRQVLSEPMIHHRTPAFDAVLARVLNRLKKVFGTTENVYLHTSTGSGGMESLLVNTLSRGDQVLTIVSGKFGERWADMARVFGCEVDTINLEWGKALDPKVLAEALSKKKYRAVMSQACETSTGVVHPIQKMGEIISGFAETLFLVDGITAVGAFPVPMDEWKIDGLVAGSQKAFMLPTGLSLVSFSKKAQKYFDQANLPRFYFDIRAERKANSKGETLFSSNVILVKALDVVLDLFEERGIEQLYKEIHERAELTRYFVKTQGLKLYSDSPSDSLTAFLVPDGVDSQKVRETLETQDSITIMGGQDQAKGKILRVGHMGYITREEMLNLFGAMTRRLTELGGKLNFDEKTILGKMNSWISDEK